MIKKSEEAFQYAIVFEEFLSRLTKEDPNASLLKDIEWIFEYSLNYAAASEIKEINQE